MKRQKKKKKEKKQNKKEENNRLTINKLAQNTDYRVQWSRKSTEAFPRRGGIKLQTSGRKLQANILMLSVLVRVI